MRMNYTCPRLIVASLSALVFVCCRTTRHIRPRSSRALFQISQSENEMPEEEGLEQVPSLDSECVSPTESSRVPAADIAETSLPAVEGAGGIACFHLGKRKSRQ